MSAKRSAPYSIDPNTFEQIEKDNQQQQQKEAMKQPIKQTEARKIFKIKRPGTVDMNQSKQTKVSFKLSSSQQLKNPNQTQQQTAKKQAIAINPFQNLFKQNQFNGIGIFSTLKSTNLFKPNDKIQQDSKNIFNTNNRKTNIFDTLNKGTSLFSNNNTTIKNTPASLFSNNNNLNTYNYDQQGSGDSAQLQNDQKLQTNPDKSAVTYNYGDTCPILLTLKALKFKKKGRQLIENVQVVIQKDNQNKMKYVTVRIPATKKSIYSGILIDNRSQVKHFNNKNQNVQVGAFSKQKEGLVKSILMFQFDKDQQGQMLFQRLNELMKKQEKQNEEKQQLKKD